MRLHDGGGDTATSLPLHDSGQMPKFEFDRRLKRNESLNRFREASMLLNLVENNIKLLRTIRDVVKPWLLIEKEWVSIGHKFMGRLVYRVTVDFFSGLCDSTWR